jgi:hypothetical protein
MVLVERWGGVHEFFYCYASNIYIFSPSIFIVILINTPSTPFPSNMSVEMPTMAAILSNHLRHRQDLFSLSSFLLAFVLPFGRPPTPDFSSGVPSD